MGKGKKSNLIIKTWERCKSMGRGRTNGGVPGLYKSKSWPSIDVSLEAEEKRRTRKSRVAPEGCFTVYVGPQKQRFVIKTEYANHPLFKILLEEAESEYGFNSEGPLVLPCNVDLFCKVLSAMDDGDNTVRQGCRFAKRYGSYQLLSPPRMMAINQI
ncbi:putative Atrazine chlorohydrolase [Hibiscus syriacus]|uniref:Atrazine chlorohydrolase n=1 Tax=Hibiscus syriacus TaxID=106335 RepID=A0A6A3D8U5_HIBSY|nr:auxin-responsive protein SAUR32-like [Hibiscus syriacus]KAE8736368.1 putative Atrazine chlorohydrolase [Hibiscus syriacus]